jgi:hypothetical protein
MVRSELIIRWEQLRMTGTPSASPFTNDLIPSHFTPAVACRLLRCSSAFLTDAIARGVIRLEPCATMRQKISRADVEKLLGRLLTAEDVLRAWAAGEPRRQANSRYYLNKKRRATQRTA